MLAFSAQILMGFHPAGRPVPPRQSLNSADSNAVGQNKTSMKPMFPIVLVFACSIAGANEAAMPSFDERIGIPPLALLDGAAEELVREKKVELPTSPSPAPAVTGTRRSIVSKMPVLIPHPDIGRIMPVFHPSSSVAYSMKILEPEVASVAQKELLR